MDKQVQLKLKNDVQELGKLAEFLERLGEEWNIPPKTIMSVNLTLEEAVSNIIFYAFQDTAVHQIEIEFQLFDDSLEMILSDDGKPFNPLIHTDPDTSLPLEERPIGGLGILLIKKLMDEISYERIENKNQMTLTIKLK